MKGWLGPRDEMRYILKLEKNPTREDDVSLFSFAMHDTRSLDLKLKTPGFLPDNLLLTEHKQWYVDQP